MFIIKLFITILKNKTNKNCTLIFLKIIKDNPKNNINITADILFPDKTIAKDPIKSKGKIRKLYFFLKKIGT